MLTWLMVDLDNTLLDFDTSSAAALQHTFTRFGIKDMAHATETYHRINRECWRDHENGLIDVPTLKKRRFAEFVEAMQLPFSGEEINRHYLGTLSQQRHEVPGARSFLNWAVKHYQLVLATNGFAEVQHPRIRQSGLGKYFSHQVISEEIGAQKPHAAFFENAFLRMGNPAKREVLMIGDNLYSDIKGAQDYGIKACWLNRNNKKFDEEAARPDYTVHTLQEINRLDILRK